MCQKYEKSPKIENDTFSTYNYKKKNSAQTPFSTRNIQMPTV